MRSGRGHSTLAWVALALVGLVVAVGISYAASQLSKPKVGLMSEPIPGARELAPAKSARGPSRSAEPVTPTTTPTAPTTTAPVPQESEGESGDDD